MKQKYQKPEIVAISLEAQQIICTSDLNYGGDGDGRPAQARPLGLDFDFELDDIVNEM